MQLIIVLTHLKTTAGHILAGVADLNPQNVVRQPGFRDRMQTVKSILDSDRTGNRVITAEDADPNIPARKTVIFDKLEVDRTGIGTHHLTGTGQRVRGPIPVAG